MQTRERLFEKWLAAGDDRTFGEWLAYRRERAQTLRCPGAIIPIQHPAQLQHLLAMQAQMQQRNPYQAQRPYGGVLSGLLGGIGRVF